MDEVKLRELRDKVILRLEGFGIVITEADHPLINMFIEQQHQWILTEINHVSLPAELELVLVDRAAGSWMEMKFLTNSLPSFDLGALGAKTIRLGDTTVEIASSMTDAELARLIIGYLTTRGDDQWSAFRRLRW
ncbi:MAG: hypothetical protein GX924_07675 [Clostridiaceae bacterium]|nr:hypothetical protein [Clostridiaceae bacterium]